MSKRYIKKHDVDILCKNCRAEFYNSICEKCGCEEYISEEWDRIYIEEDSWWRLNPKRKLISEKRAKRNPNLPEVIHLPLTKYTEVF